MIRLYEILVRFRPRIILPILTRLAFRSKTNKDIYFSFSNELDISHNQPRPTTISTTSQRTTLHAYRIRVLSTPPLNNQPPARPNTHPPTLPPSHQPTWAQRTVATSSCTHATSLPLQSASSDLTPISPTTPPTTTATHNPNHSVCASNHTTVRC